MIYSIIASIGGIILICLKHELKIIYPDIHDDTVLFQILFEIPTRGIIDLRFREECQ